MTDIHQNETQFAKLYSDAKVAKVSLDTLVSGLAEDFKAEAIIRNELKLPERARAKVEGEYNGDASRLLDICRGALVGDTLEDIYSMVKAIDRDYEIVRAKDRFLEPMASGYRDLSLNIRMPNGHIGELQIHLRELYNVKKASHQNYKRLRALMDTTASNPATLSKCEQEMRQAMLTIAFVSKGAIDTYNRRTKGMKLRYSETERCIGALTWPARTRTPDATHRAFHALLDAIKSEAPAPKPSDPALRGRKPKP